MKTYLVIERQQKAAYLIFPKLLKRSINLLN